MRFLALIALLQAAPAALATESGTLVPGTLVIVGGGLSSGNAPVHRAFLDARPNGMRRIAIIPSASGAPATSAAAFAKALVRHGADPADIVVVQLAKEDDPESRDIDEKSWAENATNPAEIARLADAGAIWFTGGDQLRTTHLLAPGGRETPMLTAIRARLARGAVIGGSSAGAAIMSRPMITEGDPLSALLQPVSRQSAVGAGAPDNRVSGGGLVMGDGLGFLPNGLVDQHFDARRRLGRLARALLELPPADRFGFGIDEDTALIVDLGKRRASVVGSASVTVLDARAASRTAGPRFGAEGLTLAVAADGAAIALDTLAITPPASSRPPRQDPDEAQPRVHHNSGGMAVPEPATGPLLADHLFGANPQPRLDRPSFRGNEGVVYRFAALPAAAAWVHEGNVSVSGIALSIIPASAAITPANHPQGALR
jgi:cyanophycinase